MRMEESIVSFNRMLPMHTKKNITLLIASAGILSYAKPAFAEDSWIDSLKNKIRHAVVMNVGSFWFDLTASTLEDYVNDHNIQPIRISDLSSNAQRELQATFPESVLSSVVIYNGIPLTSLRERIGLINYVTDLVGGVPPAGQTFGTRVYLQDFDVSDVDDRRNLAHELVHVSQYVELGYEGFRTAYLEAIAQQIPFEQYEGIPLEVDAYAFAKQWPHVAPLKLKTKANPRIDSLSYNQSIRDISDSELEKALSGSNSSSWSIKGEKTYTDLDHDGRDELCVTYTWSLPDAGNTSEASCFVVGIGEHGLRKIGEISHYEGLKCSCQSGELVVTKYEHAPSDARCCPSIKFVEVYIVKDNELVFKDENIITLDDFFHLNNWSPQFYNELDDPTPCTVEYSSKNPKTHRTEQHVLENVKINLFGRRNGAKYVNFVETPDGERIPLEVIGFMRRQGNSGYELGNIESSISGLPLRDFAFVGFVVDGVRGVGGFFLTNYGGRVNINCSAEN